MHDIKYVIYNKEFLYHMNTEENIIGSWDINGCIDTV